MGFFPRKIEINKLFFGLIMSAIALLWPTLALAQESIESFVSEIKIHDDASFTVTEIITYDFGSANRHGIFRYIEKKHPQESGWLKKRTIDIEVLSVTRDGKSEPYQLDDSRSQTYLKIGNANLTISGQHVYQIKYKVIGGLSYFDDGTSEIYWNATGHDWPAPMGPVSVVINVSSEKMSEANACYQGYLGSKGTCRAEKTSENQVIFSTNSLETGEGVTVAQAFKTNSFPVVKRETYRWLWFLIGLFGVFNLWLVRKLYLVTTKNKPPKPPQIAQYEPLPDMLPMFSGRLIDNILDPKDITAGLIYLAEQGFLRIKKTEDKIWFLKIPDYEISLLKPKAEVPTEFHKVLLELLFSDMSVGQTIKLGDLRKDSKKKLLNYKKVQALKKAITKDLVLRGYYEYVKLFGLDFFPRRTKKGYESKWYLEGFSEYLSVTDKERFKFHNSPHKSPEVFMEYLPYAIAFGVEKEWAETFKDIMMTNPDWFVGSETGKFSPVQFTSSLGGFTSTFAAVSGTSPSSGGSSGSGSSGGGGGGGGGGSW